MVKFTFDYFKSCCALAIVMFCGMSATFAQVQDSLCKSLKVTINTMPATGGKCDGKAYASVTGGAMPYTFMWSDSATTMERMNLCSNGYFVKVTDKNKCIAMAEAFVAVKQDSSANPCLNFKASIIPTLASAQGKCDGRAIVEVMGGTAPFTYAWGDSVTTKDRMNLCSKGYYVKVTDSKKCVFTADVFIGIKQDTTVQQNPCLNFKLAPNSIPVSAIGKCDGKAYVEVTGGAAPYIYMWDDSAKTQMRENLCSKVYYVNVTDSKGCKGAAQVFVSAPKDSVKPDPCVNFKASIIPTPASAQGKCDGKAFVDVVGGVAPYLYHWGDSAITKDRINLCSKGYFVEVLDSKGCKKLADIFVGVKQDTIKVDPCVNFNAIIIPTPVSGPGKCDGRAYIEVMGGAAPYAIMWNDSARVQVRDGLCSKGYYANVTDSKGCKTMVQVFIGVKQDTVKPNPCETFKAGIIPTPVSAQGKCDGKIQVEVFGGIKPYVGYFNGTNEQLVDGIKTNLCSNAYFVKVIDGNKCVVEVKTYVATKIDTSVKPENPCLSLKSVMMTMPITALNLCNGAAKLVTSGGTAPYKYAWLDSATTIDRTGLCSGSYAAKITDVKGCVFYTKGFVSVKQDTVTGNPCANFKAFIATIPVSAAGKCDGSAKVNIEGGLAPYNVMWGDMLPLKERTVCAGTYVVEVKDAKGCITKASGLVDVNATNVCGGFKATITATEKTSKCDGFAYATVTGGTAPFSFGWGNFFAGPKLANVCPGDLSVVVKDAAGCVAEAKTRISYDSTIVKPLTPPLVLRMKVQGASGANNCDGYASAYATGGVPPYSIKYSNGVSTNENYPLCPGVYSVIVADSKGNFDSLRFVVSAPERTFEKILTSLKDSVVLATSFANAITDCSINFSGIDSIRIKKYEFSVNKDSVVVSWNIYIKGSVKSVNRIYPVGQTGVYKFILDLYCGGGAAFKQAAAVDGEYAQGVETIEVKEGLVTAIATANKEVLFSVYPNPVSSILYVNAGISEYTVDVKDLIGKTVMTSNLISGNYQLNMENLPNGLYFVNVRADKFNKVVKVIKQ